MSAAALSTLTMPPNVDPDPLTAAEHQAHQLAALLNERHPGKWVVSFAPESDFVLIHRDPGS